MLIIDQSIFEKHFREDFLSLCRYAHVFVKDDEQSKDIVQQVFLKLWEKRETTVIRGSLKIYLFQTVKHRCLNHIRDHQKLSRFESLPDLPVEHEELMPNYNINALIEQLPERCRVIFLMKKIDGLSYKQISLQLNISEKTVENQVGIAFQKLREGLNKYKND